MKFVRHKVKLRTTSWKWAINVMVSVGFERVSKKRPCRICGKPTYCGFSRDEGTSICMRISAGSRGLSRNGGNIHVHPEIPFITIRPTIKRIGQSVPPAPVEIRDAVFRELIRISPASNYRQELVTCSGGLLSRGLLEEHATSYGALPRTKRERATLAGILNHYVSARFPAYAQSHSGAGVVGIPGFWQELSRVVHIWKPHNYLMPLLVIPYKDANGLIQACQIRLHPNDISTENRYCWLSSPQERLGVVRQTADMEQERHTTSLSVSLSDRICFMSEEAACDPRHLGKAIRQQMLFRQDEAPTIPLNGSETAALALLESLSNS